MTEKIHGAKSTKDVDNEKNKANILETWVESYSAISKMWEESYLKLYKPWLESTSELLDKAMEASTSNSPEKYREFYNVWMKTFQGKIGTFDNPTKTAEKNKEMLEKLLVGADETTDIYKNWIVEIEENSKKTKEALQGEIDPAKYKEVYDLWITSYAKIFDQLLTLPVRENIKEMFENYTGIPDIYSDTFVKISKLWNDSYTKLYGSWLQSILDLSKKSEEISRGNASQESYKEFYSIWADVYQKTYGKFLSIQSIKNPKEAFDNFAQTTTVYADLYKSWITTLDKLSHKYRELVTNAKVTPAQELNKEIWNLWVRIYQMTFDSLFDNIPIAGPFKEVMLPVKNAAKIYVDTIARMPDYWLQSYGRTLR
jgi:hypothetical protein